MGNVENSSHFLVNCGQFVGIYTFLISLCGIIGPMTEEITYLQLSEQFDIPSTSWNRAVHSGAVTKVRRGVFEKQSALEYCKRHFKKREKQGDQLAIDWLTESDLGSLYDFERAAYGQDAANPNVLASFLEQNPYLGKIAFRSLNRRDIWGAVRFYPVQSNAVLMQLVKLGTVGAGLRAEDLSTYDDPGVYDLYVGSIILHQDYRHHLNPLLRAYFDWWVEQYPERRVGKIWARSVSHEGAQAAITLGMSPFYLMEHGTLSPVEQAFVLDMALPHHNRLIRNFQAKLSQKSPTENR